MKLILPLSEITEVDEDAVGGKAFALYRMTGNWRHVPNAICVTTLAYKRYVEQTGLGERIMLELNRKAFADMRWEEMWDASLRIRNMFLNTLMPQDLCAELAAAIETVFPDVSVAVRSSAPGEDSASHSFAGLHESYINVRLVGSILEHIRLVWASLWSDAPLLYRKELNLRVEGSAMAVVVQEMVLGDRSGVAFGESPNDPSQSLVEAVYGLNQGLVDGTVEPDRWALDRHSGHVISHAAPKRDRYMVPDESGARLDPLPPDKASAVPLAPGELISVHSLVMMAERTFGPPQDVEWTFRDNKLYLLQSRPITTRTNDADDKRPWYMSLRRSFENLKVLREKIENEIIPGMVSAADELSESDPVGLSDTALFREIRRRAEILHHWVGVYWADLIPFAHGMRLFGQVYNDAVKPGDPYEFVELLSGAGLASIERNRALESLAAMVRDDPALAKLLKDGSLPTMGDFGVLVAEFLREFGNLSFGAADDQQALQAIGKLLIQMASVPADQKRANSADLATLERAFLSMFSDDQEIFACELLDLARASYRMRDDDNIYLGRIEEQLQRAAREGLRRLALRGVVLPDTTKPADIARAITHPGYIPRLDHSQAETPGKEHVRARQLTGQPAGPGLATAPARVILDPADLADFRAGEIIVCDAIDPRMTIVIPIASGVVERRGGMLIHGAIIAREYGLPCVTGVPEATTVIHTGDSVTVDGYLGIVTVRCSAESAHHRSRKVVKA